MSSAELSHRRVAYRDSLRSSLMFKGLPDELLDPVLDICDVRQWPKGSYLFRQGDPVEGFFLLRRGAVSIQRLAADGSEKVIHVFRTGETFAEGALQSPVYPADALAVADSETIRVGKSEFMKLLRSRNEFALRMILSLSQHLRLLVDDIEGQQTKGAVEKLGDWLFQCAGKAPAGEGPGVTVELGMSKQALAAELRMRAETLSRALTKLIDAGLIRVEGRTVEVLDVPALKRRVHGDS